VLRRRHPARAVAVLACCLVAGACSAIGGGAGTGAGSAEQQPDDSLVVDVGGDESTAAAPETGSNDGDGGGDGPESDRLVLELVAAMTPEQKVGQLLMPQVFGRGDNVTDAERQQNLAAHGFATPSEIVTGHHLGGVIYLAGNIESAPQLRAFSASLQEAAVDAVGVGLLVAVDQEGGRVSRISDEVSSFPAAGDLNADPALAREAGYVTGQQVQQQGINVVLAPVADVLPAGRSSFIGDRSFGDDPQTVAEMVTASVQGLQQSGVAAAVKHWPGHGATTVDSHNTLPTIGLERSDWERRDRVPFDAAVAEGVAIVLVGHLAFPELDPSGRPATVSPVLIDELLRDELGFDGVVMSDALNMGGVASIPAGELPVAALQAGVDIILIPPSVSQAASSLIQALNDGSITEAQLDAAVVRVLNLKQRLGLL
jgi:beta-N-acetylhexosaminidase